MIMKHYLEMGINYPYRNWRYRLFAFLEKMRLLSNPHYPDLR